MNKRRNTFKYSVAVAGLFGIISFCNAAQAVDVPASKAGVMSITMQHPGKAEMPAAVFDHESHFAKVEKDGGDCAVCHTALGKDVKGMKPFSVVPATIADRDDLMDAWHKTCMDCHTKYDNAPGAASCRSCHAEGADVDNRLPVNFDRALHAAHIDSKHIPAVAAEGTQAVELKNCGACHSTVDASGKEVYVQDTEDAFSFYKADSANSRELASIAHNSCVSCHMEAMADSSKGLSLPIDCTDCHSAEGQAKFPAAQAPRLFRGQPDVIVLGQKGPEYLLKRKNQLEAPLRAVPFDHKLHEEAASCSECHGMKIEKDALGESATLASNGISAFSAAHDVTSASSCEGCHAKTIAADKNCAGCHDALKFEVKDSCVVCHNSEADALKLESAPVAPAPALAKNGSAPIDPADVPETVTIDVLANEYQPVELPHRAIYKAMLDGMKDSKMAAAFHVDSVCKACHHNIPNENITNPPSCASCHDTEVKAATVGQAPHLKAAYHQMCISCHSAMEIKPAAADCADCHAPVVSKDITTNKREVR